MNRSPWRLEEVDGSPWRLGEVDGGDEQYPVELVGPSRWGETSFCEIWWPVRWVPDVRWRNNYFARSKEALPCCGRGPNCQPLYAQSTSDGSRSLTMLTTPRREHQGGG